MRIGDYQMKDLIYQSICQHREFSLLNFSIQMGSPSLRTNVLFFSLPTLNIVLFPPPSCLPICM